MQHHGCRRSASSVAAALLCLAGASACDMRYESEAPPEVAQTAEQPVTAAPAVSRGEPYIVPAGRSPIPAEGETFDAPIAAKQLELPPEPAEQPPPAGAILPWSEAGQYIGHTVTAEGVIEETANIGNICFLNFLEGDRKQFYIVVYREVYADVPGGEPETYYLNKRLRVTGEVTTHNARPQIRVRDIHQIEVVP